MQVANFQWRPTLGARGHEPAVPRRIRLARAQRQPAPGYAITAGEDQHRRGALLIEGVADNVGEHGRILPRWRPRTTRLVGLFMGRLAGKKNGYPDFSVGRPH